MGAHVVAILLAVCFDAPVRFATSADQAVMLRGDEIITSGNQVDEVSGFSILRDGHEEIVHGGFGEKVEAIGDLDGDGVAEIVTSDYWSNGIAIYRGSQRTAYTTATHGGPSLITDFDHDGKADVISFSFGSGNLVRAHFFRGNGDGTLAPKTTYDTNLANAATPSMRTMNGALEILVSEHARNLAILRYANGSLSVSRIAAASGVDFSCTFADVNGDGIADIVEIDDTPLVSVRIGNADGTFGAPIPLHSTLAFPLFVHAADDMFVVSGFRSPTLEVFHGLGDPLAIDAAGPVNTFAVGDGEIVTVNDDHTVSVIRERDCARRRGARH